MKRAAGTGFTVLLCAATTGGALGQSASPASAPAVVIYAKDNAPAIPKQDDLPLKDTVTKDGVTWTFEKPARVGQSVNGDFYVVGPVGFESFADVKLGADVETEIKRLNDRITRLAPAILAGPSRAKVEMIVSRNLACHLMATELDGVTYVFAQNTDEGREKLAPGQAVTPRGGKVTIKVAGLKAGTKIEVVDESRHIIAEDDQFSDDFGPLAEHLYRTDWHHRKYLVCRVGKKKWEQPRDGPRITQDDSHRTRRRLRPCAEGFGRASS